MLLSFARLRACWTRLTKRRPTGRRPRAAGWSFDSLEERLVPAITSIRELAYEASPAAIAPDWFAQVQSPALPTDSGAQEAPVIHAMHWDGLAVEVYQDEWIVQLDRRSTARLDTVEDAASLLSTAEVNFEIVGGLGMKGQLLLRTAGVNEAVVQDWLESNPSVAYFEPNLLLSSIAQIPNDASFSSLWGMHNTGQTGGTADADIDAPEAWEISTGSDQIVVAVIDTGVDYTHPDLVANMWANPGEIAGNGIDDDGNGFVDDIHGYDFVNNDGNPMDDHSHGTHVAGTIAGAGNNGAGVAGVNWSSSIMALKFLSASGSGSIADAVEAVNYITMMKTTYGVNVRLSNNSWGGGGYSQSMYDAIAANNAADILFVAAAGNSSTNNDVTPHYPSNYDIDNVISVAATDHNDNLASFSCYGATTVDLAAPGVSIYSTLPGGSYGSYSGTSMATPHVAGVAALAWSVNPGASALQIRDAIFQGTDTVASLSGDVATGGRLNARNTLELLGMSVVGSDPAADSTVAAAPTSFRIDLSVAYDPSTAAPTDLSVNGMPANQVSVVDSDSLLFTFASSPVTVEGAQTMQVAEGAISSLDGSDSVNSWQADFYFDGLPLAVIATTPTEGATLAAAPSEIVLDFNEPLDPTSVDVGDLHLDFGSVTSATMLDSDSVRYAVDVTRTEGEVTYTLLAEAVRDAHGTPGPGHVGSFIIDDPLIERYTATDTPVDLLDDGSTLVSLLTISDTLSIGDLDVELDIEHTWDEDLVVDLVAPDGTTIRLFAAVGGSGRDFTGTVLDDEAPVAIADGEAPFTGRFQPQEPLSAVDGTNVAGVWRLEITDTWPYLDSGVLNGWSLVARRGPLSVVDSNPSAGSVVTTPPTAIAVEFSVPYDPASIDAGDLTVNGIPANGFTLVDAQTVSFEFASSPVTVEGAQTMQIAEGAIDNSMSGGALSEWQATFYYTSLVLAATPVSPALGATLALPPTEIIFDFSKPVDPASVDTSDLSLSDGAVISATALDADSVRYTVLIPVLEGTIDYTIPAGALSDGDGVPNAAYAGNFVIDNPVLERFDATDTPVEIIDDGRTVVSTITVPQSFIIADLSVELDITHTWDSDLEAFLVAPDGTRIELFTDVGGAGENFTGTILDDEALLSIADGVAPFTGRYRPEGSLAVVDGKSAVGVWRLEITDTFEYLDSGVLNAWSLVARAEASFVLTGPTSGTYTAGEIVPIEWTAAAVPEGSTISLCYDEDTTWWNGNEHWIEVDQVAAANGAGSYNWNTSGVAAGNYYVAGYLYDQAGGFTFSRLTQTIRIEAGVTQSFVLTGPTSGTYTAGDIVPVQWTAGGVVPGSKISLCYDEDTTWWNGNEHWFAVDQIAAADGDGSYNWSTVSVPAGTYYLAGYMYDYAGTFTSSHLTQAIQIEEGQAQAFDLTGPTSGTYTAGDTVAIQWTAAGVVPGSKISLCYDEDTTWWNGNEHWIEVDQVAAANGDDTYNWDTSSVPVGTYYLAGYMYDFAGTFTSSHLTQAIEIQASQEQTFVLTGPTSGTYTAGDVVTVQWTAGGVVPGSKISLCYDEDATLWNGNEHWIEVDQVTAANGNATYNWNTVGVSAGTYYLAGYMYDFAGTFTSSHLTQAIQIQDGQEQTFVLTGPTSGTYAAGDSIPIQWTAGGVVAGSKISLCYDQDTTLWNGNEHWIVVDQVTAVNGNDTYNWDTTGVTPGTYYVAGYMYDFAGTFTFSHLTDSIAITAAGSPLRLADHPDTTAGEDEQPAPLTPDELAPIATQAIAGWQDAALTVEQLDTLKDISFVVADLPDDRLGLATGDNTVYIDVDAAGQGWFVDRTPQANEEFQLQDGQLVALDPQAVDRIDLLTVVYHEIGHLLGLEDLDAAGTLMSEELSPGIRHQPSEALIDSCFSGPLGE